MIDPNLANFLIFAGNLLLKSLLLIGSATVLCLSLRQSSAALRHRIWIAAFIGLATLPLISTVVPVPHWELALLPSMEPKSFTDPSAVRISVHTATLESTQPISANNPTPPATDTDPHGFTWSSSVPWLSIWLAGALLGVFRFLVDLVRVRNITKRSRPIRPPMTSPIRQRLLARHRRLQNVLILFTDELEAPLTWGLARPVILLPASANTWPQDRWDAVLLHEWAHVARRDYLGLILRRLVVSFYWPNPFVWAAERKATQAQETACDDWAIQAGMPPGVFAAQLFEIAKALPRTSGAASPGAIAMARSTVRQRIASLLNRSTVRKRPTRRLTLALSVVGLATYLSIATFAATSATFAATSDGTVSLIEDLTSSDPHIRQRTAWALGELEADGAVEALVQGLGDPNAAVRGVSAWALGEIKAPRSLFALTNLLSDPDPYVREMAVRAIGELEDERALATLVELVDDREPAVHVARLWSLGEIGGAVAASALGKELFDAQDESIRRAAAIALGKIETDLAFAKLIEAMDDSSPAVREAIATSLGRFARHGKNGGSRDAAIHALRRGTQDSSPIVRKVTAKLLGELGDEAAVDDLLDLLRDPDPEVRARAIWALDEINPSKKRHEGLP